MLKRTNTCGNLNINNVGDTVILNGWVHRIRDLGGIKFIVLRDRYGLTQISFDSQKNEKLYNMSLNLGNEYTVSVKGIVEKRPEEAINKNMKTGEIEVSATSLEILSKADTTPIYVNRDDEVSENLRLKYRYLDLRKEKLQKNLILRHKVMQSTRNFFSNNDFLEIETPYMTKSTPEGARDFLVPSRLKPNCFYALPQSPQLFKQLLMVSGFDKYFQIARCFRDEDFRADRQPEFSQIDFEASFVEKDDILDYIEKLLKKIFKDSLNIDIETPLRRIPYDVAQNTYGSDKPDTRYGMKFIDITEYFKNTEASFIKNVIEDNGIIKGFVIPNMAGNFSRKKFDNLVDAAKKFGANGLIWIAKDKNKEGFRSSIKKIASNEIFEMINHGIIKDDDVMLIICGELKKVNNYLGLMRNIIIRDELPKKSGFDILFIVDFPMFSYSEEEQRLAAEHHPFTMPNIDDLNKYADSDPLKIKAECYDLVINGFEMASGSVRIHRSDIQKKIFEIIGLTEEEIAEKFGFFIEAFKYGAPPHAGAALGLDRLVAIMAGEDSIKEVIAFPKTATGFDPMSEAPSKVDPKQLYDLKLKTLD